MNGAGRAAVAASKGGPFPWGKLTVLAFPGPASGIPVGAFVLLAGPFVQDSVGPFPGDAAGAFTLLQT